MKTKNSELIVKKFFESWLKGCRHTAKRYGKNYDIDIKLEKDAEKLHNALEDTKYAELIEEYQNCIKIGKVNEYIREKFNID